MTPAAARSRALDVADVGFGLAMAALDPAHPGDLLLEGIVPIGRLAGVRVAGHSLSRLGRAMFTSVGANWTVSSPLETS